MYSMTWGGADRKLGSRLSPRPDGGEAGRLARLRADLRRADVVMLLADFELGGVRLRKRQARELLAEFGGKLTGRYTDDGRVRVVVLHKRPVD